MPDATRRNTENYRRFFAVKMMVSATPPMTMRLTIRTAKQVLSLRRRTSRGKRGNSHFPKMFVNRSIDLFRPFAVRIVSNTFSAAPEKGKRCGRNVQNRSRPKTAGQQNAGSMFAADLRASSSPTLSASQRESCIALVSIQRQMKCRSACCAPTDQLFHRPIQLLRFILLVAKQTNQQTGTGMPRFPRRQGIQPIQSVQPRADPAN